MMQKRCVAWVKQVFGDKVATDHRERALRVVEEAIELGQAMGLSSADVDALRDQVFAKTPGDPGQEIAGVLFTTFAAADSMDMDALSELLVELLRVEKPAVIEHILAKSHAKYRNEEAFK